MTNNSDSDPNFQFQPCAPSNAALPTFPQQPLPLPLPSSSQNPRKKRTKTAKNEAVTASSSSPKPVSRPKCSRKPDPSAPKITPPCTECGKEFWSWKALFGHMRCHPEREWRGINPPPNYRRPVSPNKPQLRDSWLSIMTEDDHDIASCLLMLANSVTGPSGSTSTDVVECGPSYNPPPQQENEPPSLNPGLGYRFECRVCKKVFGSHQALGGHRASHKNVKGCFAITNSCDVHENAVEGQHKCNVCSRVFSSGQALGGHMRCHWERSEDNHEPSSTLHHSGFSSSLVGKQACVLDLNVPATTEDSPPPSSSSSDTFSCTLDLRLGL